MKKVSVGIEPLIYPQPVLLVATYDEQGKANVMNAAWGGIAASEPLCVSVGVRPSRHTHDALLKRRAFTLNIPSIDMVKAADYVGIYSGRNVDKFAKCGLSAVKSELVDAPYIAQCPVVLQCALHETVDLASHTLMIGRVLDVLVDENCLDGDSIPQLEKIAPLMYDSGSRHYYAVGRKIAPSFSVGLDKDE